MFDKQILTNLKSITNDRGLGLSEENIELSVGLKKVRLCKVPVFFMVSVKVFLPDEEQCQNRKMFSWPESRLDQMSQKFSMFVDQMFQFVI